MTRYGFDIVAMWEAKPAERIEFVYLLRWTDEETKTQAWAAFMADQEWGAIKKATRHRGDRVGDIQDRPLLLTDYSPALLKDTGSMGSRHSGGVNSSGDCTTAARPPSWGLISATDRMMNLGKEERQ